MDIDFVHQNINGLHRELHVGQHQRVDDLNSRISSRQFSDKPLRPNFDPRPVPTKYSLFPIIERRAPRTIAIDPVNIHKVENNFNPSTRKYPFSSFQNNIDQEIYLRNQGVVMSKDDGAHYVPSSKSELYGVRLPETVGTGVHQHPLLFQKHQFHSPLPDITTGKIGQSSLFNHTRTQLRDLA
jgi:hypothetical protein